MHILAKLNHKLSKSYLISPYRVVRNPSTILTVDLHQPRSCNCLSKSKLHEHFVFGKATLYMRRGWKKQLSFTCTQFVVGKTTLYEVRLKKQLWHSFTCNVLSSIYSGDTNWATPRFFGGFGFSNYMIRGVGAGGQEALAPTFWEGGHCPSPTFCSVYWYGH